MKPGFRRFMLPGGGSFDIPLPGNATTLKSQQLMVTSGASTCPVVIPVLAGVLVGAGATWAVCRYLRNR